MILFEDDHIIAVEKPEGLASIPERNADVPPLLGLVSQQCEQRLYVVHRLDKDVSGVILFAKTSEAHRRLSDQFSNHHVEKHYDALVHGALRTDCGIIRRPIREFGSGRMGVDQRHGKPARTAYEVIERLPAFTMLHVTPQTGRRHQIRVHLFSFGHPVVGDARYGARDLQEGFPRLMLHATQLTFTSPSGLEVTVDSPLAPTFTSVLDRIRSGYGDTSGDAN
jgi:RluA family pseudouridine synthase